MKEIPLTQGYVAVVDDEDFERVSRFKWRAKVHRRHDGSIRCVYAVRHIQRANSRWTVDPMHRFILGVSDSALEVDHRDHDGLNNTRKNLRVCTGAENRRNSRKYHNSRSRFKGAYFDKQRSRWYAQIRFNGYALTLGRFKTEIQAALAYDRAARKYHGEFALLNFPIERTILSVAA